MSKHRIGKEWVDEVPINPEKGLATAILSSIFYVIFFEKGYLKCKQVKKQTSFLNVFEQSIHTSQENSDYFQGSRKNWIGPCRSLIIKSKLNFYITSAIH